MDNKKTDKSIDILSRLKLVFLILYFLILFCERLLAVIFSINTGEEYALVSGNVFNYITYGITSVSLVASIVLMIKVLPKMFVSVFTGKAYDFAANYKSIVIAAMAILYGGMMHTGFTVAYVQFVAYGFLIASMVIRTIECRERRFESVISVIYLTLFAMAVPICYISFLPMPLQAFFFIVEFAAVFVLVPVFGWMLLKFYQTGVTSFSFIFPLLMLVLSGLTVPLKWNEEINWFVLIFLISTMVFYLTFGLVALKKSRG